MAGCQQITTQAIVVLALAHTNRRPGLLVKATLVTTPPEVVLPQEPIGCWLQSAVVIKVVWGRPPIV